jgi:hypothetical protein
MSFVFVYSQYFYTRVVDLVSREDDVSDADDDDRKMPAVLKTSPKRKQSVPRPAAEFTCPVKTSMLVSSINWRTLLTKVLLLPSRRRWML